MNFWQIRKQVGFRVASWFFACALSAAAQQNMAPASPSSVPFAGATIVDIKGKVEIQLPGQGLSVAAQRQVLPAESTITTENGQLLLQLKDGDVVVHPHTRLVLKEPSATNWQRLQLWLGRIKLEVQKRISGSPPFQIGTPSAVISVRGTRFTVDVDRHGVTKVEVEEGVVELTNVKGIGAPILIKAGSSSRVGEDSAPEPAHPIQGPQPQSEGSDQRNDMAKDRDTGFGRINGPQPSAGRKH